MEALAAAPGGLHQVSQCSFTFFDVNDTLDATARPTDRAEKGNNRVRTALANAFKAESGVMTVLQRTSGISSEYTRLGKQVSDRLTCTPLNGSTEMKDKLTGKFVPEPIRLIVPSDSSKETAKKITECSIKTKLHVTACSGANATDGTGTMRPWEFDGLALEQLNNPISSVERISQQTHGDARVAPAPAAAPAAAGGATKPSAQNPWMTATSGGGRGGGRKRGAGRGMEGPVNEDCDGLGDDGDDEHTVPSPSIAERTRSGIARRIAAVRLLVIGGDSSDCLGAAETDAERDAAVGTELGWA